MTNSIEKLQKRLDKDPNSLIFFQLAEEHRKEGNLQESQSILEQGLSRHPNYWSARVTLARIYHQLGEIEPAREELEKVVHAVPDHLLANRLLGEIYLARNQNDDALKRFRVVEMLSPADQEIATHIKRLEADSNVAPVEQEFASPRQPATNAPTAPEPAPEPEPETYAPTIQMKIPEFLEKTEAVIQPPIVTDSVPMENEMGPTEPPVFNIEPEPERAEEMGDLQQPLEEDDEDIVVESAEPLVEDFHVPESSHVAEELSSIASLLLTPEGEPVENSDFQELESELEDSEYHLEPLTEDSEGPQQKVMDRTQPIAESDGDTDADELTTETLAELYLNQGLVEKAVKVYQKLLLNDPGNTQILQRLRQLSNDSGSIPFAPQREDSMDEVLVAQAASPSKSQASIRDGISDHDKERRRKINTLENWLTTIRHGR